MHQVFAHRNGGKPILRCEVCREEQVLLEGAFDTINTFLQLHITCATLQGTSGPLANRRNISGR